MNTPTFYIQTQIIENYGAHDQDGRFINGNAYWKFKSGNEYIVTGLQRIQDAVAYIAARCSNNISFKEFPSDWQEVEASFQTPFEKSQMEFDGKIAYPCERIDVQAELDAKRKALYASSAGRAEITRRRMDRGHGSPWDRGHSDAYYGRSKNPHFYMAGAYEGERITDLTLAEKAEYEMGYEECDDRKDWGGTPTAEDYACYYETMHSR
jgi:hypothetical protein